MPKRARSHVSTAGSTKRRRTYRTKYPRYRVRRRPGTTITAPYGLPERARFRHRYAEVISVTTPGAGVPWQYRFSVNSLYDPNSSGTGHQPYYFDEMANLWNQYIVKGSKITVRASKYNSAADVPVVLTLWVEDDTSTPVDIQTSMEQGRKIRLIGADDGVVKLTKGWSMKKSFPATNRNLLAAAPTANPSEQQFFYLSAQAADLSNSATIYLTVEVEYYTEWFEKKTVIGS